MEKLALYKSLNVIRYSSEHEAFREWLKDQREKSRDRLETLSGDALLAEQGYVRALKMIQEQIEAAPKCLEQMNSRRP